MNLHKFIFSIPLVLPVSVWQNQRYAKEEGHARHDIAHCYSVNFYIYCSVEQAGIKRMNYREGIKALSCLEMKSFFKQESTM